MPVAKKDTAMDTQTNPKETRPSHPFLAATLALLAGLLRLFPHPWNFAPMGAIGIFAGARLRGWPGLALPVGVAVLTDLVLWMKYPEYPPFQWFTYLSYILCGLLGRTVQTSSSPWKIVGLGLLSSIVFFVITNFGAWLLWTDTYPDRSLSGLLQAYVAGIPFYRGTFFGDLIYTPVLFGAYALLTHWLVRTAPVPQAEPEAPETV
jgi:hypothetical protein